jgi:hypothetical protein
MIKNFVDKLFAFFPVLENDSCCSTTQYSKYNRVLEFDGRTNDGLMNDSEVARTAPFYLLLVLVRTKARIGLGNPL